jgi:hypothetical protein
MGPSPAFGFYLEFKSEIDYKRKKKARRFEV